jgi:hypothetical protein
MQARYLETAQASSGKSSFHEGHGASSAQEDSFDLKKYKPISKAAGSRARLNSPEASFNNLFQEGLQRSRASRRQSGPDRRAAAPNADRGSNAPRATELGQFPAARREAGRCRLASDYRASTGRCYGPAAAGNRPQARLSDCKRSAGH